MNSFEKKILILKKDDKDSFIALVKQLSTKEKQILFDTIDSRIRKLQTIYLNKPFNLKFLQTFIKEDSDEDEDDDDEEENGEEDEEEDDVIEDDDDSTKDIGKSRDSDKSIKGKEKGKEKEKEKEEERYETKVIPKKPIYKDQQQQQQEPLQQQLQQKPISPIKDNSGVSYNTSFSSLSSLSMSTSSSSTSLLSTSLLSASLLSASSSGLSTSSLSSSLSSSSINNSNSNNSSSPLSSSPLTSSSSSSSSPLQRIQSIQNLIRSNSLRTSLSSSSSLLPNLIQLQQSPSPPLPSPSQPQQQQQQHNQLQQSNNNNNISPRTQLLNNTTTLLPNNGLEEIFNDSNKIGEGGQCSIYKYMGTAMKRFKPSLSSSLISKEFENEVLILERLNHPNIVKIITYSTIERIILLEFIDGNSLDKYPSQSPPPPPSLSPPSLPNPLKIIQDFQQIVDAMIYLHNEIGIIHFDLKPSNILKNSKNNKLKLIDFGISKFLNNNNQNNNNQNNSLNMGSYRYSPPELLCNNQNNNNLINKSVDVFSFGIMLWECLNWRLPYESLSREQVKQIKTDMERESYLPLDHLPKGIQDLIRLCWKHDPSIRPSFIEIRSRLSEIILNNIPSLNGRQFWISSSKYLQQNDDSLINNQNNQNNNNNNQYSNNNKQSSNQINNNNNNNNKDETTSIIIYESIPWLKFKTFLSNHLNIYRQSSTSNSTSNSNSTFNLNNNSLRNNNNQRQHQQQQQQQQQQNNRNRSVYNSNNNIINNNINNNNNNRNRNYNAYYEYIFDYIRYILKVIDEKRDEVSVIEFSRFCTFFSPLISSSLFRSIQIFCDIPGLYGYCLKKDLILSSSMITLMSKIGYLIFIDPNNINQLFLKMKAPINSSSNKNNNNNNNNSSNNNNNDNNNPSNFIDFTIRVKIGNYNQRIFQCHGHTSSSLSGLIKELQPLIDNNNSGNNSSSGSSSSSSSSSSKKSNSGFLYQKTPISEIKDRHINGSYLNQNYK
ncbi:hypothetical protein ACTFIW_000158 [Dictyostelium discoideum]